MEACDVVTWSLVGVLLGSLLACIPGLHVGSTLAVLMYCAAGKVSTPCIVPFVISLVVSYSVLGFVPLVFLSVPDESLFAAISPSQRMLEEGHGMRAAHLGGIGALAGTLISACVLGFIGRRVLPALSQVLGSHWHWLVWAVVIFILMSEWPQRVGPGLTRKRRFLAAWRSLLVGLAVFALSGLLGIIVFFRSGQELGSSFAGIMPMVCGMFSVPWLLMSIYRKSRIPRQSHGIGGAISRKELMSGCLTGWLGGAFAGVIPGVTAGVGGLVAGHTCSLNGRNGFIVAQGCARGAYMSGGLMLLFVPGLSMTRGGCSMMLRALHQPFAQREFAIVLAVSILAAAVSILLCRPLCIGFLWVLDRVGGRIISGCSLVLLMLVNWMITGWWGLAVMGAASLIGGTAIVYGGRRMNCLGCILIPVGIALSGWGGSFVGVQL